MTKQLSSYLGIPSLVLLFRAIGSRRSMEQWCSKLTHIVDVGSGTSNKAMLRGCARCTPK